MKQENTSACIRVYANQNQINSCKERMEDLNGPLQVLANTLSLAGNEVRLKMLFLLQEEGELCPCDISDILSMTVPAVSQHLRKLKDGNVVKTKKVAQTVFYSLTPEGEKQLRHHFEFLTNFDTKKVK